MVHDKTPGKAGFPRLPPPWQQPVPTQYQAGHQAALVAPTLEYTHYLTQAHQLLQAAGEGDGLVLRKFSRPAPIPAGVQRVVVVPSTARGMADASALISNWHRDLPRPILLVVRDIPLPPPKIVVRRIQALSQRYQTMIELPYIPQLRMLDDPADLPHLRGRAVRKTLKRLRQVRQRLYVSAAFVAYTPPVGVPESTLDLQEPAHQVIPVNP